MGSSKCFRKNSSQSTLLGWILFTDHFGGNRDDFLNQTSAAGLYTIDDFRLVCDTLDFESMQEAHINAFKTIGEQVESELFGERIFTYSMRPYFAETMIFQNTNWIKRFWKRLQIQAYSFLSSGNAFIACQYLTVRGLRTLNGKIVQHQLSQFHSKSEDKKTPYSKSN